MPKIIRVKMLASTQNSIYSAILKNDFQQLSLFSSNHQAQRLSIYRANILENMRNSLSINYPGVWRLLGKACADNLAHAFCLIKENFPATGYLEEWGEGFADFLSEQKELKALPYLKDFARYEWLIHCSYCADSVASITASDLQIYLDQGCEDMHFFLPPSMFLFTANFPIDKIQTIIENKDNEVIDLCATKVYGVIARPQEQVETFCIRPGIILFSLGA